jgi:hypothetical protein
LILNWTQISQDDLVDSDFAIAYFRDELKSAGLNPEINIQHQDNRSNPHHTQELDKIKKFLGFNDETGIY